MKNLFGEREKAQKTPKKEKSIDIIEKKIEKIEEQVQELLRQQNELILTAKAQIAENSPETAYETETIIETIPETIPETAPIEEEYHGETEEEGPIDDYIVIKEPRKQPNAVKILEDEAVKEVQINRKKIIMEKIEDALRRHEMNAKELKIVIVDRHKYCSKATFYRYLEQLRKEERIDSIKINGKEYLCSIPSKPEPTF